MAKKVWGGTLNAPFREGFSKQVALIKKKVQGLMRLGRVPFSTLESVLAEDSPWFQDSQKAIPLLAQGNSEALSKLTVTLELEPSSDSEGLALAHLLFYKGLGLYRCGAEGESSAYFKKALQAAGSCGALMGLKYHVEEAAWAMNRGEFKEAVQTLLPWLEMGRVVELEGSCGAPQNEITGLWDGYTLSRALGVMGTCCTPLCYLKEAEIFLELEKNLTKRLGILNLIHSHFSRMVFFNVFRENFDACEKIFSHTPETLQGSPNAWMNVLKYQAQYFLRIDKPSAARQALCQAQHLATYHQIAPQFINVNYEQQLLELFLRQREDLESLSPCGTGEMGSPAGLEDHYLQTQTILLQIAQGLAQPLLASQIDQEMARLRSVLDKCSETGWKLLEIQTQAVLGQCEFRLGNPTDAQRFFTLAHDGAVQAHLPVMRNFLRLVIGILFEGSASGLLPYLIEYGLHRDFYRYLEMQMQIQCHAKFLFKKYLHANDSEPRSFLFEEFEELLAEKTSVIFFRNHHLFLYFDSESWQILTCGETSLTQSLVIEIFQNSRLELSQDHIHQKFYQVAFHPFKHSARIRVQVLRASQFLNPLGMEIVWMKEEKLFRIKSSKNLVFLDLHF